MAKIIFMFTKFQNQLFTNDCYNLALADTGANASVCGVHSAKRWNLLDRMCKTGVKINSITAKPYPQSV